MNSTLPIDYWEKHGPIFLLGLILVPRLALLFSDYHFTLIDWLLWLFLPKLLVAILATAYYWETNSYLCVLSWLLVLQIISL